MKEQEIQLKTLTLNLSPEAFHKWAEHYYKCKQDFRSPDKFSPVPYFLLCRALELEIKSIHLKSKRQSEVKNDYGHDLIKAYETLSKGEKILTPSELSFLKGANVIYKSKGFEYFKPMDALKGYSEHPILEELDKIAKKLIYHHE